MKLEDLKFDELTRYSFGAYDVPHLGALCKRVRKARSISGTAMAKWCGVRSTRTITQDFELNNQLGSEYFEQYAKALQSKKMTLTPILPNQAQMLTNWHNDRGDYKLKNRISQLAAISFEDIHPGNPQRPRQLADLVQQLSCERQPALIMDDLWFIHALNEAQLRMYNIAPEADFLHRWEGWHTIAGKVYRGSPVRQAHDEAGQFIPPTIVSIGGLAQTRNMISDMSSWLRTSSAQCPTESLSPAARIAASASRTACIRPSLSQQNCSITSSQTSG